MLSNTEHIAILDTIPPCATPFFLSIRSISHTAHSPQEVSPIYKGHPHPKAKVSRLPVWGQCTCRAMCFERKESKGDTTSCNCPVLSPGGTADHVGVHGRAGGCQCANPIIQVGQGGSVRCRWGPRAETRKDDAGSEVALPFLGICGHGSLPGRPHKASAAGEKIDRGGLPVFIRSHTPGPGSHVTCETYW